MTTRRELLGHGAAIALLLGVPPATVWAQVKGNPGRRDPWLERISDLVIPATDTPGATAAGVPAFVRASIGLGLRGASDTGYRAFRAALDARSGDRFEALPVARAVTILAAIDQAVLGAHASGESAPAPTDPLSFWRTLKALIVMGYYSSEIGASQELQYELVPGHFDPDVPLTQQPRAWSSDWTGVKYA